MKAKLFWLIHNERPYKRYYNEPLKDGKNGFLYEIILYKNIIHTALRLPFNKNFNRQQFAGERKSKWQMVKENLLWTLKFKEVCYYYFLYGLDIKGHDPKDYIGYTEFRVIRNIINIRQRENKRTRYTFNYLALVRDKFVFYQYCKSLDIPCPKTVGLVSKGSVSWYNGKTIDFKPLDTIFEQSFDAFCKEVDGESGMGAFHLKVENGRLFDRDDEISFNELKHRFGESTFLIQERLKNHPAIDAVYNKSLNTIKLITFLKENGEVEFFDSVLRFGAGGNFVDNASSGGIFVGIEENGHLMDVGYHEPGKKMNLVVDGIHPDTGVKFGGMEVPYWHEILTTAKRFHKFFYAIPSIGWDIAITPNGFVFTETGEDWEIPVYQVTHGGLREKFYRTHGFALNIKLRKY